MNTYEIIKKIASTRSRNDKEKILKENAHSIELKEFFRLALSPTINFYQKKKFIQESTGSNSLTNSMDWLNSVIAGRKITGNEAIAQIQKEINNLPEDDAKVIMHILQKESGCDVGESTINKIWPKLIPTFPCLLATAYDEKLAAKLDWGKGVFSNLKSDGGRCAIIVDYDGTVKLYSRAGNELNVFGEFDFMGEHAFNHGMVFDGELLTINESGKFNPRTISNGIFNKCVRDTISEDEAKTLHVTLWDCIPLDDFKNEYSQLEYAFRFESLSSKLKQFTSSKVSLIPTRIVHSLEQANQHYQELLAAGEEGSILKDRSMLWENKRSKKQLKLKSEVSGEFVVTGYNAGEGKLVGNLGSLYIESADSKIVAAMSGFSLKLRSEIWANITNSPVKYSMIESGSEVEYFAQPGDTDININSIIECEYNQLVKGKDNEVYSLFLPRFKCVRSDKKIANTLEELLK